MNAKSSLAVLLILSVLMSFASVATDIYLPALPTLTKALHTNTAGIELTFSTFLIGFSLGQLFWGPVSDRYGRRRPIAIGIALFVIGSAGCAMSVSVSQLMAFRVVQALGACVGPVLSRAMVRDLYEKEKSAHVLSRLILIMSVAPLVGPLLGGQILKYWNWQGIFWILCLVGTLTFISLLLLPESLSHERRNKSPLYRVLPEYVRLISNPKIIGYALAGGFFYGGVYAFIAGTPFVYIDYYHLSPQSYGWLFALNIVGMMLANFLNGKLLHRFDSERLFQIGTWTLMIAGLSIAVEGQSSWGGVTGLVIPIFFFVSMNGLIVANSVAGALAFAPESAGAASSLLGAMHYGSGILTAAMVGWLSDGTPRPMAWVMGIAGVGSLAASLLVTRGKKAPDRASALQAR